MNQMQRAVVLLTLLEQLKQRGSWCGETHLQKATYFLQQMMRVPLDFEFVLYKHGPFSFDLNDEITALRADQLLTVQPRSPYGPSLYPSDAGRALFERYQQTLERYTKAIQFVAERLAQKNVSELERLGTALYVSSIAPTNGHDTRPEQLQALKPHVLADDAREAVRVVDEMKEAARASLPA
jgi:uncharacterized protein YwgA